MSYEFTKLSGVPAVSEFPEGANAIIETNGEIKRCPSSKTPKPLTYDYMPEGYPTKTIQTTTVMAEQALAFSLMDGAIYGTTMPTALDIVEGQTYMVNWDGTEYECVGTIFNGRIHVLGNLSIAGVGDDTGEPFLYASDEEKFLTLDTSASHTISVKTTEEVVTPMAEEFLPENLATKLDVAVVRNTADNAQTAADNAQTAAENAQTAADSAQAAANAAQTTAENALERVIEPYTRNMQMAPLYKNGGFSAWCDVVQNISYNKTEGYFFANAFDTTALKEDDMPSGVFCVDVHLGSTSATAFLSCFITNINLWSVSGFAVITHNDSQAGELMYVSANTIPKNEAKGLFLTFRAPNSMLLKSSTANSDKQFRITVDDSGTLTATEVT